MNDLATLAVVAPETYCCDRCARQAVFVECTADLARYICPLPHLTLVDLTKLKAKQ